LIKTTLLLTWAAVSGFGCDRLLCRIYLVAACGHGQVVSVPAAKRKIRFLVIYPNDLKRQVVTPM